MSLNSLSRESDPFICAGLGEECAKEEGASVY